MLNESTEKVLKEAEGLLKKLDRINKFGAKYSVAPAREMVKVSRDMQELASSIPEIRTVENQDQLFLSEVKRRMYGEAAYLDKRLSGKLYDFETVIRLLGIPNEDIDSLRPWLESNKDKTQEAIERLFHSRDIEGYELPLAIDIPSVRRQVEEFAGAHIQRYHKTIGKFLQSFTNIGEFLRDINAVPTTERSYFNHYSNTLAVNIPSICFSKEDGTLHIRDGEIIRIYGHEGMGHALNFVVTNANGLPYFLTQGSHLATPTAESIAQFYENVLLEDLRKSPEIQKALGIEHKFSDIYREAKDTEQLKDYNQRLFQYSISVLGDKNLGKYDDPEIMKIKTEIISQVAINKSEVNSWIQNHRYNFDSEGNLDTSTIAELRYCARPVSRALNEFGKRGIDYEGKGRDLIDSTFLRGLWTPIGFVDNARLKAEDYKKASR